MDDKWIDSIRDKMADYDAVPPAGLLDAIESEVRARKMRRRRIFGAVAASVALIGGVSIALTHYMSDTHPLSLVSEKVGEETGKDIGENISKELINRIAETAVGSQTVGVSPRSGRVVAANIADMDSETILPTESEDNPDVPDAYVDEAQTEARPYNPSGKTDDAGYDKHDEYALSGQSMDARSDTHAPVAVGVYTSANGLGGIFSEDGIGKRPLLASASMPHTRMGGGFIGESNSYDPPAPTFIEVFDHKLPIRASVDFSWPIGYNLSLGTGITYSYLRSDIRYGHSDSPLFKASQSLHFLGIPVNVRYIPWSFKKLHLYASAGIMAEKCISGQIKTGNPQTPGYSYVGCDDRPFQFSVNAAAGLQYSLARNCAVFIEPGIGFYLRNGSRLRTIYSERPVTFNLNVGLRFGR